MFTEEILSKSKNQIKYYIKIDKFKTKDKFISKEINIKENIIIHYPFRVDYEKNEIQLKYPNIKQINYTGFGDKDNKLPVGVFKSPKKGYGFTKGIRNIIYFIQEQFPNISVIEITNNANAKTQINIDKFIFNVVDFNDAYNLITPFNKDKKNQLEIIISNYFAEIFPNTFKKKEKEYISGNLANFINGYSITDNQLSDKDIQSIFKLIKNNIKNNSNKIIATKQSLDIVYLEDILDKFNSLLLSNATEPRWHGFFKENKALFSQIFYTPQIFFGSENYLGGKDIFGKNGKFGDFIYKNKLTDNILIVEIKTHKTKLLENKPYRGTDVYPVSKEFSGGINQILDQKQNLLNEFNSIHTKTTTKHKNIEFSAFNPQCFLLIGVTTELAENDKRKSFELFRNSIKDINIMTFDEFLERLKLTLDLFKITYNSTTKFSDYLIMDNNKLLISTDKVSNMKTIDSKQFKESIK
ncbi:MAG: DUF4263 domain-containing protein [Candidatus ainarchaeum sp.]|nr:DUF4263 domain-containing protein [Candidatus ainarchaeum sp.]